jgi:hypothetical protein
MPTDPSFPLPEGSTYSPIDDVLDAIPGDDMAYEDTPEGDMVGRDEQGRVSGLIVHGAARRIRRDSGLYSRLPGLGRVRIAGAEQIIGVEDGGPARDASAAPRSAREPRGSNTVP